MAGVEGLVPDRPSALPFDTIFMAVDRGGDGSEQRCFLDHKEQCSPSSGELRLGQFVEDDGGFATEA